MYLISNQLYIFPKFRYMNLHVNIIDTQLKHNRNKNLCEILVYLKYKDTWHQINIIE